MGATLPMAAFHSGTPLDASRWAMHAVASLKRHSSMTWFSALRTQCCGSGVRLKLQQLRQA